jgi:hypothetical protein
MILKTKTLVSAVCLALLVSSCGGGGSNSKSSSNIIKNDKLHPFLLSGIYTVNGYGGADEFFGYFSEGMNAKAGERKFLPELEEAYSELFIFPYTDMKSEVRRELSRSWDIDSKSDFLETAEYLLAQGHQQAYEFCRKVLDENGGAQANINQIDLNKYASEYDGYYGELENIKFVKDNYHKFSSAGIKAWDIARYVNNVNMARCADYISEAEGYKLAANALVEAQKHYQDWDQFWNDFNLGRYFWGGDDDPVFYEIAAALTNKNNKYSIYHYMPLHQ